MCGKLYEFPLQREWRSMEKGYIIAYCEECGQEHGRFFLPEEAKDVRIECLSCGEECKIFHISEFEIREVSRVKNEGMCELCMYYDLPPKEIGFDPCENCNGANNWEARDE